MKNLKPSIPLFIATLFLTFNTAAQAAWQNVPYGQFNMWSDNGVTYVSALPGSSWTLLGNCLYGRLELRETDYYGNVENGKRIMSMLLTAKATGKNVYFGYNDTDGPTCRIASINVQW